MKKLFFIIFTFLLLSCESKVNKGEENTFKVISVLYNYMTKSNNVVFPPPPPDSLGYIFTSIDSIRVDSLIKRIKDERTEKKLIVAVYSFLDPYNKVHHKYFMKDCSVFNNVMDKLLEIKDTLKIDIDKIITKRNDSIIYFKKELLDEYSKDFYKFDILISFSRIAFNKEYTKAIMVGSLSHSTISGASVLYFLEKVNNNWEIKCAKELSIS